MSNPYLGEIRIFAGNFAPLGWMLCHGQLVPISEYDALFSLIGTTYGGDGASTFGLPDLRSRVPVNNGDAYILGETGGTEQVTLTPQQLPSHTHGWQATTSAAQNANPVNNGFAQGAAEVYNTSQAPTAPMAAGVVGMAGRSHPHTNIQPYIGINYIIAMYGVYPTRD